MNELFTELKPQDSKQKKRLLVRRLIAFSLTIVVSVSVILALNRNSWGNVSPSNFVGIISISVCVFFFMLWLAAKLTNYLMVIIFGEVEKIEEEKMHERSLAIEEAIRNSESFKQKTTDLHDFYIRFSFMAPAFIGMAFIGVFAFGIPKSPAICISSIVAAALSNFSFRRHIDFFKIAAVLLFVFELLSFLTIRFISQCFGITEDSALEAEFMISLLVAFYIADMKRPAK